MKKLLGIVILSLLLSTNAYAADIKVLDKGKNYIIIKEIRDHGRWHGKSILNHPEALKIADRYCASVGLYAFNIIAKISNNLYSIYPMWEGGYRDYLTWADVDWAGLAGGKDKYRYFCAKTKQEALSYFESNIPLSFKSKIVVYENVPLVVAIPRQVINNPRAIEKYIVRTVSRDLLAKEEAKKQKDKEEERKAKLAEQKKQQEKQRIAEEKKKKEEEKRKAEKPKEKKKKEPKQTEQKSNDEKIYSVGSGTGFFINRSGHIVSNNHVIDSCNAVKLHYKGKVTPVTILATDRSNDLSLMKVDTKPDDVFPVAIDDANLLDDIFVAGFPFGKDVSSSVKVTKGVVSALTGIANNYSNIQIDAALQPGNSGGPIINKEGNVVGVAVAKLDYKIILKNYDTIPEGTNFGIKSSTVQQFIKANNVKSMQPNRREMSTKDIGAKIQKATVYLDCFMTAERYEQLKSKKVMYKNIE